MGAATQVMSRGITQSGSLLICRVGSRLCGLQLGHVVETMRLLPIDSIAGAPSFICGLSTIRGESVPVVDLGALLGVEQTAMKRIVLIDVDHRRVALAVDAVLGTRELGEDSLRGLPPLLDGAGGDVIAALGSLDAELLMVLGEDRLVPDSVWAVLDEALPT